MKEILAREKVERGIGLGVDGWMEALKALWVGGLRQMSVPGGEERVKGGRWVVVVLGDSRAMVRGWRRMRREKSMVDWVIYVYGE